MFGHKLNSTKNLANNLSSTIAGQSDQIKGIAKDVDLLAKHTKEGERNLNIIESGSRSYLYLCCKQCSKTGSTEEINLSPNESRENLRDLQARLPITVQPKLNSKQLRKSIDYGDRREIDRAIDSYLGECEDSIQFIKQQAIAQGNELDKQNKDLGRLQAKVEHNTTKFKGLTTKTRKLISRNNFFSFF